MEIFNRRRMDSGEEGVIKLILVDIDVPATGRTYDFRLDENTYIADIIDEIGGMLTTNVEEEAFETVKEMILCDYEYQRVLPLDATLKQCGIGSGYRLVLL